MGGEDHSNSTEFTGRAKLLAQLVDVSKSSVAVHYVRPENGALDTPLLRSYIRYDARARVFTVLFVRLDGTTKSLFQINASGSDVNGLKPPKAPPSERPTTLEFANGKALEDERTADPRENDNLLNALAAQAKVQQTLVGDRGS